MIMNLSLLWSPKTVFYYNGEGWYAHTVNVSHSTILEIILIYLHFRNTEGLPIPLDITIQTFVGLILAMIAVLNIAGDFKEIRASVEMSAKSWETVSNRPSFYVYNHRVGYS